MVSRSGLPSGGPLQLSLTSCALSALRLTRMPASSCLVLLPPRPHPLPQHAFSTMMGCEPRETSGLSFFQQALCHRYKKKIKLQRGANAFIPIYSAQKPSRTAGLLFTDMHEWLHYQTKATTTKKKSRERSLCRERPGDEPGMRQMGGN